MTAVTVDDLISETRRHVYGTSQGRYNFLTSTITSGDTTLTVDLPTEGIVAGTIIAIDEELILVKSVAAQVITVYRGFEDSTAAAHSAGVIIEVQPRFSRFAIQKALLEEIRSWPRGLFTKATATISGSTSTRAYSLTSLGTSWYNIVEVRYGPTTDDTYPIVKSFDVDRGANTLYLPEILANGYDMKVTYTSPFVLSTFAITTDVVGTCGLTDSMVDIPCYGAAWRLLAPREVKRTFTESQNEPRVNEQVPPGVALQTAAGLKNIRDKRIVEETDRLAATVALRW